MLEIIIGIISGIVSGIGMGGGTILILILTIFLNIDQHVAQAINLIFFIPTAIAAIIVNSKQKLIDFKTSNIISVFGVIGAIIGSIIANNINSSILRKIFGVFLAIIAINEIISYKNMNTSTKKRHNIKR